MRFIIEWLDKDDNVLFRKDQLPSISFGGTVQVTPAIPEVKTEINLPGFPAIKGIMDDAANKYVRESITAFRIRVLEDEPEKKVNWLHTFEFKEGVDIKETAHLSNIPLGSPSLCECCGEYPHQYTLSDNDYKYQVCANCLLALVNTALSPAQFFSLIRNGHTTKEFLLHGDFYDDETGEALQPRGRS